METVVKFSGTKKKSEVPVTMEWKNARMVRAHSVRAATREILNMSRGLDVVKINIIGSPSTGKTTLAETLAHLCHTLADIPYTVKKFSREDLLRFEETLATLQPTNHILIFDDISFLTASASGKQIKQIEKAFTEIRHLPGGQDVKIIAIFNFHYNMAISKYMRQSEIFCYNSIGSSELENTQNIIGKKYTSQIMKFKDCFQQSITTEKFIVKLGNKGQKFIYQYKQPFVPILWFNGSSARLIVSPKRDWIDPICSKCANSNVKDIKDSGDIIKLAERLKAEFKPPVIIQAMKIKLFNMGVNTYQKRVKDCMKAIDTELQRNICNAEEMAEFYGLKDKVTQYHPTPEIQGKFYTGIK